MGRQPCCDKVGLKKGPWTAEEDKKLINFIINNGQCCWRAVPKFAGLLRCGKSCRLRWTNYLRPDLKRGLLSEPEEKLVIDLHSQLGNKWSKIAACLPGRTDNEIKNHWNTHIKKKLRKMGIDPLTHKPLPPEDQPPTSASATASSTGVDHKCHHFTTPSPLEDSVAAELAFLSKSPGFSTDEVPMIEPHEIIVPCTSSSSSSSSSSTTVMATKSCSSASLNSSPEEIQLPLMGWPELMYFWGVDDFMGCDFISDEGEGKLSYTEPFINQYNHRSSSTAAAFYQEPWKFELF